MKPADFPIDIRSFIIPEPKGELKYRCLGCSQNYDIKKLLYTCPECGNVLLLYDENFDALKKIPGETWRKIFDYRKMLTIPALKGIYLYQSFPLSPLLTCYFYEDLRSE